MKKFGLIGFPLGHSFSKNFFNEKFHSENIDAEYVNFEIPTIEDFPKVLAANPNLAGLNVTIPYKEKVIPYLDELDKDAEAIGAVNVIKLVQTKGKRKLIGYNSDLLGFTQSIEPLLEPFHKESADPGNRRSVESHQSRTSTAGTGNAVCFTKPPRCQYSDLRRTDSGNHGRI